MGTYTNGLVAWATGQKRQIKDIRAAIAIDDMVNLAADISELNQKKVNAWGDKETRSYNAAYQREIKAQAKANNVEPVMMSLKFNKDTLITTHEVAGAPKAPKPKCPMLQAIAKLKAEKKDTPEAIKTIVTLIESYIAAE